MIAQKKYFILDVYRAGEAAIEGVNSKSFVEQSNHKNINYVNDAKNLVATIRGSASEKDVIVTMGAGDVSKLSDELVEQS